MEKIFIVNPTSGHGKSLEIMQYIEKKCKENNEKYRIIYTTKPKEAETIAEYYKNKNVIVYSVGGDGTLNEVINGLAYGNSFLHLIPGGSGNDFYKTLSLKKEGLLDIDLGKVNDKYFINIASVGFDAEVTANAEKMKKLHIPSSQIYNVSLLYTYYKLKNQKISENGQDKNATLLAIANGKYYGGGFKIAPDAKIDDGYLNYILAEDLNHLNLIPVLIKLIKGEHYKSKHVEHGLVKNLSIKSSIDLLCNADGELIRGKEFDISVCKDAIRYYNYDDYKIKSLL